MKAKFLCFLADNLFAMGVMLFVGGCFCSMNVFLVMIFTIIFISVLCLSIKNFFSDGTSACILYTGFILVMALISFLFQLHPLLKNIIVASDCLRWWCIGFFIAGAVMYIIPLLKEQCFFLGMTVLFIEGYLIDFITTIDNPFVNEDFFWCTTGLRCFAVAGVGILCITFGLLKYDVSQDDEDDASTNEAQQTEHEPPPLVNEGISADQVPSDENAEQIGSKANAEQSKLEAIKEVEFAKKVIRCIRWSIITFGVILLFWAVANILQHLGIF